MSQYVQQAIRIFLLIMVAMATGVAQTETASIPDSLQQAWQYFDAPINPNTYLIRPGERLVVNFVGTTLKPLELVVDAEGAVIDPGLGRYDLSRRTLAEVRTILTEPLQRYFRAREIIISIEEARPVSISVAGAVLRPGTYRVFSSQSVSDVLNLAGGILPNGSRRRIEFSGGVATIPVDLERAFALSDQGTNPPVYSGRNIFVPSQSGQAVTVRGEVHRPGTIELAVGDDLRTILALAGGVRPTGDTAQIHYANSTTPIGLGDSIRAGQRIIVPPSSQALMQSGVLVGGAVTQPGAMAYASGMTVEAAITGAGGFTDQANRERVTVFRRAEDGRVLANGSSRYPISSLPSMVVQPFDSIVVPIRVGYVAVTGAASGQLLLPYVAEKSAGYYVDAAGGVPRSAQNHMVMRINRVTGIRQEIRLSDIMADGDEIVISWIGGKP